MVNYNFDIAEKDLLFKVITGSKAYGLELPTSDTDIRGIYLQPNEFLLANGYKEQLNDVKNDIVYYELNRFISLLVDNNPNIIEILFTPEDKILYFDERIKPLYDNRMKFLTKKLQFTFGGYSVSQIKKARGLNKKIVNPMPKERKSILDFCYIFEKENGYMMLAEQWLRKHNKIEDRIGLSEMPNGVQLYKVFYDESQIHGFKGILSKNGDDLKHSEIPKNFNVEAFLYYNKDGYSSYCKKYKEYWEWVEKRNPHRYNDNINNSQNYDGKNLMHCLRMLEMAIEIGEGKGVNVARPNREWLLSIRKGMVSYDEIMKLVEEKNNKMIEVFSKSDLPDEVDENMVNDIILQIRNK
jgi:predicted nucleotidyltransferase